MTDSKIKIFFLFFFLNLIFVQKEGSASAEEIPEHFSPVRPLGMGGAFTAVANDENFVWTNPAGVSRTRKHRSRTSIHLVRAPNIIVGANKDSGNFYQTLKSTQDETITDSLSDGNQGGKPLYARGSIFPMLTFDTVGRQAPMGLGFYSNTTTKALVENANATEARIEAISDIGSIFTFGMTDSTNQFAMGLQFRPLLRYAYEDRVPSEILTDQNKLKERLKEDANQMTGIGIDFGMLYTVADFWFPSFGFAILNLPTGCKKDYLNPFTEKPTSVCGNVYRGEIQNPDALSTIDPTDIRIGFSITPRLGRSISMRLALDAHHLPIGSETQSLGLLGIDAQKLIHAGFELFAGNPLEISPFSIRAGYSQGFATAGASLNLRYLNLSFATYGRDISNRARSMEDRRYVGAISFGL